MTIKHLLITFSVIRVGGFAIGATRFRCYDNLERLQALADVSRLPLSCHSNETRATIANPPNSAQLGGTLSIPQTYILVRAVVWACGRGQRHRRL